MEIVVEVVSTVLVAQKYQVDSLPNNFGELSEFDKWNYLSEYGVNVAENEMYSNLENVNVNWEG